MHLNFLNTSQLLTKAYDQIRKNIQNEYQLIGAEVDVLLFLANNPSHTTAQSIVDVHKLTKSHASLALKILVEKGYVDKTQNPDNKKEFNLTLTTKAHSIIKYGQSRQREFIEILFDGLNEIDLNQFFQYLSMIERNLQKKVNHD